MALNVVDGNVIDVGYASVIGADQLTDGGPLYGAFPPDNPHGDTYGPVVYAAYAPFEALLPWGGSWDDLPAAHAAAIAFDLGCAALLWLLGRRLRGPELGLLLAYLWMTYPFTLMVANSGSNDALVALLVLAALLAASRPAARGALVALAGLTKLAPLALVPLFAAHRPRRLPATGAAFPRSCSSRWRRSTSRCCGTARSASRPDRGSPFSIWGFYALPGALQAMAQVAAIAFAFGVAFLRPAAASGTAALAALAAAVLIALQLAVDHWFYLYLVWFAPLVWVALLGDAQPAGRRICSIESAAPRRRRPDQDRVDPRVLVGGVVAHRHVRAHDRDRLLAAHADHAAARAGHADVGDVGGPAREHARVGGRHVRVGPDHRGHLAVEVPPERDLLARRLRVHVDEHVVGARDLAQRARRRSTSAGLPACM